MMIQNIFVWRKKFRFKKFLGVKPFWFDKKRFWKTRIYTIRSTAIIFILIFSVEITNRFSQSIQPWVMWFACFSMSRNVAPLFPSNIFYNPVVFLPKNWFPIKRQIRKVSTQLFVTHYKLFLVQTNSKLDILLALLIITNSGGGG